MSTTVDHPEHYGGGDNPYEAIKVIEAWELVFCLGNTIKYICRAGKKRKFIDTSSFGGGSAKTSAPLLDAEIEDLEKARWYLDRQISALKEKAAELTRG